jgi:hypothetical protein
VRADGRGGRHGHGPHARRTWETARRARERALHVRALARGTDPAGEPYVGRLCGAAWTSHVRHWIALRLAHKKPLLDN